MKVYIHHKICIIVVASLILGACAPAYVPNVVNTPLFSEKGELQASVSTGISGFDPQIAYSITDHMGIMANTSFADRTSDSTENFHHHQFGEIGAGYFTKIGENGRFETFGGVGIGKVTTNYENELWQSYTSVNNIRFFLQPTIGITTDIFDGAFSTRFIYINLFDGTNTNSGVFFEPIITNKLGFRFFKTMLQLGLPIPVNNETLVFEYQPLLFTIGLQLNLDKIYKDIKEK